MYHPRWIKWCALCGLIVFGVLALWWKMADKFVATLIAGVVLFTMARIGWNIIRA